MNTSTAGQIVIVVSGICMAINAHQFTLSYSQIQEQIQEFVDAVNQGEADEKALFWLHNFLYFVLPTIFLYILFEAEIAIWLIICLGVKCLFAGLFTHWQQSRLVGGEIYLYSHHVSSKIDNLLNILIFGLILLGVFGV